MTFPVSMLLVFALWTIVLLVLTVGVYRWSHVLTGKAQFVDYRADDVRGSEFYKRAMRAHANCIENLPVFGAVVFAVYASGISSSAIDTMCAVVVLARIAQSILHVALVQTNPIIFIRFCAFFTQIICFFSIAIIVFLY
jgi:uncharacterized MAPEG superfamily protein